MRIDEMPAGREMDKAISRYIFGNTKFCCKDYDDDYHAIKEPNGCFVNYELVPRYSTDIAASWEVVKRMPIPFKLEKCWEKAYQIGPEGWSACWCTDADCEGCNENSRCTNGDDAWAETAPLAICRAALKAMGVTEC